MGFHRSTTLRKATGIGLLKKIQNECAREYSTMVFDISNVNDLLAWSIQHNNLEYVKYLITTQGADPNDRAGYPVAYSVINKNYEILEFLFQNGANPKVTLGGMIPVYDFKTVGDDHIIKDLLSKYSK